MTTRRDVNLGILSAMGAVAGAAASRAQGAQTVDLPPPILDGGKTLMQSLKERRSTREYSDRELPDQVLSNLLWAAWGVNRPQTDGRTAPHWHNVYAMDIYLTRARGVWLYQPKGQRLAFHMPGDLRAQTTTGQAFAATAPLNLVYAFDLSKLVPATASEKLIAAAACAAVVAQNVHLYCASDGLATVIRQSVPGERLAKALALPAGWIIQFAQTVGYPKG